MLTDNRVKAAKAREKDYKLGDGGGLYLFVTTKGHKSWRFKYRFAGKEMRLVFGAYPAVKLVEARSLRDDAKRHLRDGRDPAYERSSGRTGLWKAVQKPRFLLKGCAAHCLALVKSD